MYAVTSPYVMALLKPGHWSGPILWSAFSTSVSPGTMTEIGIQSTGLERGISNFPLQEESPVLQCHHLIFVLYLFHMPSFGCGRGQKCGDNRGE